MKVDQASATAIEWAAGLIRSGQLVAFPTETVYGLGADATQDQAVAAIFEAKGRPRFNPLIVHVPDLASARQLGRFGPLAVTLAQACWPGPLTLVVPRATNCPISQLATAGLDTIALRVPRHAVALALLVAAGRPIAAPSANPSGHVSPTLAEHVAADLKERVAMILDGGPAEVGLESTVVDATGSQPVMLRSGGTTREEIERACGQVSLLATEGGERPVSPGQLLSHYAPSVPVRLNVVSLRADEALLAFGPSLPATSGLVFNLSPGADLREAAANLFAGLRSLDRPGVSAIAVMAIPHTGLGTAINDRLTRAARR